MAKKIFFFFPKGTVNLVFPGATVESTHEDYTYKPKPEIQVLSLYVCISVSFWYEILEVAAPVCVSLNDY